jgi:hypothetical protein
MATRFHKATGSMLALAAMLAGCAHGSQRAGSGDGPADLALRATLAAQVINPAAGRNPNPAAGLDGNSARAATERYERGPATPAEGAGAAASPIMTK